ncbi:unnamed protein product [Amoebophrya sp. A25]|nr:unnamed protein product [Amoebophrya sp. A25]|eukprot:GSA25T00022571001.1
MLLFPFIQTTMLRWILQACWRSCLLLFILVNALIAATEAAWTAVDPSLSSDSLGLQLVSEQGNTHLLNSESDERVLEAIFAFGDSCFSQKAIQKKVQAAISKVEGSRGGDVFRVLQLWNRGLSGLDRKVKMCAMSENPFKFLRGSDHLYFQDFVQLKQELPRLMAEYEFDTWIQGDLHTENMGSFRNSQQEIVFAMNDFDEALEADWQFDLWRLATAVITHARSMRLLKGAAESRVANSSVEDHTKTKLKGQGEMMPMIEVVKLQEWQNVERIMLPGEKGNATRDDSTAKKTKSKGSDIDEDALAQKLVLELVAGYFREFDGPLRSGLGPPDMEESPEIAKWLREKDKSRSRIKLLDKYAPFDPLVGNRQFRVNAKLGRANADIFRLIATGIGTYYRSLTSAAKQDLDVLQFLGLKDVVLRNLAGTGSLGAGRYYILFEGETPAPDDDIILDVKEQGRPSALFFLREKYFEKYVARFRQNDAVRHNVARRRMQLHVDEYLGLVVDDRTGETFSVEQLSPWKGSFPYHKYRGDFPALRRIFGQIGRIVAREHRLKAPHFDAFIRRRFFGGTEGPSSEKASAPVAEATSSADQLLSSSEVQSGLSNLYTGVATSARTSLTRTIVESREHLAVVDPKIGVRIDDSKMLQPVTSLPHRKLTNVDSSDSSRKKCGEETDGRSVRDNYAVFVSHVALEYSKRTEQDYNKFVKKLHRVLEWNCSGSPALFDPSLYNVTDQIYIEEDDTELAASRNNGIMESAYGNNTVNEQLAWARFAGRSQLEAGASSSLNRSILLAAVRQVLLDPRQPSLSGADTKHNSFFDIFDSIFRPYHLLCIAALVTSSVVVLMILSRRSVFRGQGIGATPLLGDVYP